MPPRRRAATYARRRKRRMDLVECNASKCNLEVTTWMRRKKLDERAFLVRQAEVALMVGA